ncbi:MAG: tetratricopeptide repeat protein [Candidatus Thorarchaeota archaeon]
MTQENEVDEARSLYSRGKNFLKFGELDAAEEALCRATELDPTLTLAWDVLGRVYDEMGKAEKAIECIGRAAELDSENLVILEDLGILQFHEKQMSGAVKTLKRYMELGGADIGALLALAKAALELDHCKTVLNTTSRLLEIDDDLYHAWELRGICLAKKHKYNPAITSLNMAVEIHPESISALNAVGDLCYNVGNYIRAVEFYEPSLEVDNKQPEILFRCGISYWFLEKWQEALPYFERYTSLVPDDPRGWNNLGCVFREKGDVKRAMECYTLALELDPHLDIVKANQETAKHMQVIP